MKAENRAVWALGIVIVLLAGSIIFQLVINAANDQQDRNIRESQFRACVINGNTLRDQVRREFVDLKRKILIPSAERNRELYSAVASLSDSPSVVSVLEDAAEAEREQIAYLKMRIKTIRDRLPDVRCIQVYPPLKGQDYPPIRVPENAVKGRRPEDSPRAESEGGGSSSTGSAPPSISGPPSGGPTNPPQQGPGGGGNGGAPPVGNPPTPPPPSNPPEPGLLDPAVDQVCDLTAPVVHVPAVCD